MLTFYILKPSDNAETCATNENNLLGTLSFNKFTAGSGFHILNSIVDESPQLLELLRIKDSKNTDYTMEQFYDVLIKCKKINTLN